MGNVPLSVWVTMSTAFNFSSMTSSSGRVWPLSSPSSAPSLRLFCRLWSKMAPASLPSWIANGYISPNSASEMLYCSAICTVSRGAVFNTRNLFRKVWLAGRGQLSVSRGDVFADVRRHRLAVADKSFADTSIVYRPRLDPMHVGISIVQG